MEGTRLLRSWACLFLDVQCPRKGRKCKHGHSYEQHWMRVASCFYWWTGHPTKPDVTSNKGRSSDQLLTPPKRGKPHQNEKFYEFLFHRRHALSFEKGSVEIRCASCSSRASPESKYYKQDIIPRGQGFTARHWSTR